MSEFSTAFAAFSHIAFDVISPSRAPSPHFPLIRLLYIVLSTHFEPSVTTQAQSLQFDFVSPVWGLYFPLAQTLQSD
jgi:hypothetical protein